MSELTIFSLDEDDKGSLLVSVNVGNKLVVLVARAFWCTGKFSKRIGRLCTFYHGKFVILK